MWAWTREGDMQKPAPLLAVPSCITVRQALEAAVTLLPVASWQSTCPGKL